MAYPSALDEPLGSGELASHVLRRSNISRNHSCGGGSVALTLYSLSLMTDCSSRRGIKLRATNLYGSGSDDSSPWSVMASSGRLEKGWMSQRL